MFTDAAIKEIARIALERGTGARGPRSVIRFRFKFNSFRKIKRYLREELGPPRKFRM